MNIDIEHLEERRQRFIRLLRKGNGRKTVHQQKVWDEALEAMPLNELRACWKHINTPNCL